MNLGYEINYTLRALNRKRGFSLICIFVIALGFAITVPLYSIVRNIAFAPLPFPDGDRIVTLKSSSFLNLDSGYFDVFQFKAIQDNANSFEVLSMEQSFSAIVSDGEIAQVFSGTRIGAEALEFTETQPELGRALLSSDRQSNAEPVVLLSDYIWRSYYDGRPDIVGTSSRINGSPHTIIGVMPAGFSFPLVTDIWLPIDVNVLAEPGAEDAVQIIGKLKTGVSHENATNEVQAILDRQAEEYPDVYEGASAEVVPLIHRGFEGINVISSMFGGLALCIFLLICLNVGNLLTIRANERVNELAVRTAMGANRLSLFSHVLLESFLICLIGSAAGLLAVAGILGYIESAMMSQNPNGKGIPYWIDVGFPVDVILVSVSLVVALWVASSFFAAWRAAKVDVAVSLGNDAKGSQSTETGKIIRGLVQMQVVLSFFLLILSGVFVLEANSILDVSQLPDADKYFTTTVSLPENSYENEAKRSEYRLQLRQRLLEFPEIEAAAYSASPPGIGGWGFVTMMEGEEASADSSLPQSGVKWVDENYFPLVAAQDLLEGRYFDAGDSFASQQVVIVDDLFLREKQLDESIIGKRIQIQDTQGESVELARVVGVVRNNIREGRVLGDGSSPTVYRPIAQSLPPTLQLLLKTSLNDTVSPALLEQRIKLTAAAVDRDVPLSSFRSLPEVVEGNNVLLQFFLRVIVYAALGALVLAIISIYGVISRSVVSRIFEIGIRRAIGSSNVAIVNIFLKQGLSYLFVGIVLGGGAATLLMNSVQSAYPDFGIFYSLFIAFSSVTVTTGALIWYASYLPVRRVVAMEPGEALHYE